MKTAIRVLAVFYGLLGAAGITYGIYQIYPPGAFIFAGAFCIFDAWRLIRVKPPVRNT